MARIIIIIAAIVLALYLWRWLAAQYQQKGRSFAVKATLIITAALMLVLAAAGRVHWIGALLASGLAGLRFALPLVLRSLPFLQQFQKARANSQQGQAHQSRATAGVLSESEARKVLGVNANASREEIIEAHRKLIQKMHPDRGGSDYLAAKINQAKDLLLKKFS